MIPPSEFAFPMPEEAEMGYMQQPLHLPLPYQQRSMPVEAVMDDEALAMERQTRAMEDALGAQLQAKFQEWRTARMAKEDEWLADLRAYNGIYEADVAKVIQESGRSDVFVHITRTKVSAAYTRLVDLLFQTSDKHWGIDTTPIPTGPMPVDEYGMPLTPEAIKEAAEAAVSAMELVMEDQLEEAGYESALKQAIAEACILGSGAIKGVTVGVSQDQSWENFGGTWSLVTNEKVVPAISAVSVFDLYPEPYSTQLKDCDGIFQRHILTRPQFRDMAEKFGFNQQAVADVFSASAKGNYTLESHEVERRRIAGFASDLGGNSRFEVLEYWGWVSGDQLIGCGCHVDDPNADYQANVWVCGGRTVKVRLNPHRPERLPYQIFPYERVPHQFWGVGVPRQIHDSQSTINAAVRALLDNLAISSGPMVEVNVDMIADPNDPLDMSPWRVWRRSGGDPSYPLLRFYSIENVSSNLTGVIDMFRRFVDEESSLPSYTHGEAMPGLNKTASGMSMLMSAASIAIKGIVKNIDDYLVGPLLESLYDWNMKWNGRTDIKGDMRVVARGSTALIAKEVKSQRLIQFLQMTANPLDAPSVDRVALLREVAQAMDINPDQVIISNEQLAPVEALVDAGGGPGGIGLDGAPGMGSIPAIPDPAAGNV